MRAGRRGATIPAVEASLSDSERLAVRETLRELREAPAPRNLSGVGCVIALPAFAVLLVFPVVGRWLDVGMGVAKLVLILAGALLVVGLLLWFTAGGFARGHVMAAAEAALRTLAAGEEDRDVLLRAATLLLFNAYATYGPSTVEAFDFDATRARLGPRLELVVAVERLLLEDGAIYPVFTAAAGGDGEAPA